LAAQALARADEAKLPPIEQDLAERTNRLETTRRACWVRALSRLPRDLNAGELRRWRQFAQSAEALTPTGAFWDQLEQAWFVALLRDLRQDAATAEVVADWPFDPVRQLDQLLAERPTLRVFRGELQGVLARFATGVLRTYRAQESWVTLLQEWFGA